MMGSSGLESIPTQTPVTRQLTGCVRAQPPVSLRPLTVSPGKGASIAPNGFCAAGVVARLSAVKVRVPMSV